MNRNLRAALACTAVLCLARCDCDGSIADAGRDASTPLVDANSQVGDGGGDAGAFDRGATDGDRADASTTDRVTADRIATDAAAGDQVAADAPAPDGTGSDGGLGDAVAGDTGAGDVGPGDVGPGDVGPGDGGAPAPDCATAAGLCIQLSWDRALSDLDLHLSRSETKWCRDDTCYWANCGHEQDLANRTDWDGVAGISAGDPTIYGEQRLGGPEVLHVPAPQDGDYTLGVYHQLPSTLPASTATVRIYLDGVQQQQLSRSLSPGQFWEVGAFVIATGSLTYAGPQLLCSDNRQPCGDSVHTCPTAN